MPEPGTIPRRVQMMGFAGVFLSMKEETKETQESSWQEAHPWLSQMTSAEDKDDSVGKVIRYTLDELRFALRLHFPAASIFQALQDFLLLGIPGLWYDRE